MRDLHDLIAQLACELYRKSGNIEGRDLDNWLDAERTIMSLHSIEEGLVE
jgi:hypothetical protein